MSQSVLVTGGTGFFGRRIVAALGKSGFEVVAPTRPDFDLLDPRSTARVLDAVRPSIVVHSAAYYGGLGLCTEDPAGLFHTNVLMAANLFHALPAAGVERVVSIGSACAYPGDVDGDMRESDFWSGPLHPSVAAYGFTKKVQQVGLEAYRRQYGIRCQFPVFTNLYGEHDVFTLRRSHVVAALIRRFSDAVRSGSPTVSCWGTGAAVREFLYVGDAAEAVARLLRTEHSAPLNIGTGTGTCIRELAEMVRRLIGFTGRIEWGRPDQDGVPRKVLDVGNMRQVLGWTPPTALEEGLEITIRWYLANKEMADARP